MIESEIVATGSVKGVLSGKHYNRSIRTHKVIYEAMERLRFEVFENSLSAAEKTAFHVIGFKGHEESERQNLPDICASDNVTDAKSLYDTFVKSQCEKNLLFSFWSMYIEMVQILLLYIRATRTSNWDLHLSTLRSMIPWFFATDRTNYSRYAPCYYLEMKCLHQTHPCKQYHGSNVVLFYSYFRVFHIIHVYFRYPIRCFCAYWKQLDRSKTKRVCILKCGL